MDRQSFTFNLESKETTVPTKTYTTFRLGSQINRSNESIFSPSIRKIDSFDIFSAIQNKDIAEINKFLDDFSIYQINQNNETVMDVAVQVGDLNIIVLLLEKEKDFLHITLPTAIEKKNIALVKLLLEKGANVNRISKKTNKSPLSQAINQQNEDMVKLLLQFNANVKTNEDPSPFQRALQLGNRTIIKMLLKKIARNEQEMFLQMAIDENNINVIIYLLKNGADPRKALDRLKELANKNDLLDIVLGNSLLNINKKTNKSETQ